MIELLKRLVAEAHCQEGAHVEVTIPADIFIAAAELLDSLK